jgi:beta-lactam-binding protein with PASTA domain
VRPATLQDLGLTVRFNNVIGEIFGGTVQSTDPGADTPVPRGTTVTVNLG